MKPNIDIEDHKGSRNVNLIRSNKYLWIRLLSVLTDCFVNSKYDCFRCAVRIFFQCKIILKMCHTGAIGIKFIYLFIYSNRYKQLRVEITRPILSRAFRANIPTTKSQTGNILGVSGIWKHCGVSNAIRCSSPAGYMVNCWPWASCGPKNVPFSVWKQ